MDYERLRCPICNTRMRISRGADPEEPVTCAGCGYVFGTPSERLPSIPPRPAAKPAPAAKRKPPTGKARPAAGKAKPPAGKAKPAAGRAAAAPKRKKPPANTPPSRRRPTRGGLERTPPLPKTPPSRPRPTRGGLERTPPPPKTPPSRPRPTRGGLEKTPAPAKTPSTPAKPPSPAAKPPADPGRAPGTPGGRTLKFPTLEALIQLLEVLIDRGDSDGRLRRELRIRRTDSGAVVLVMPAGLGELPPAIADAARVSGAAGADGDAAGETLTINRFLESVRLRGRTRAPDLLECLFVLKPKATPEEIGEIYRSFPRGYCAQCRFFPARHRGPDGKDVQLELVLFEHLRGVPRIAQWIRSLPAGAAAFYPIGGWANDVFFCQWQFAQPVAALARLYDAGDCRYILMGEPDSGARPWLKISRRDADRAFLSSHQRFTVTVDPDRGARPVQLAAAGANQPIELPVRTTRSPERGMAVSAQLARRTEALRRKLSDLEGKYETIQQATRGHCRVALVFHQGRQRDSLPPRLCRFVTRPYQTLDSYTYFCLVAGRRLSHVLFSKAPIPLAEALVACADELYVQDARWQSWGLNVFLRHGVEISPRLDDPALVEQFNAFFHPGGSRQTAECCLVDARPPAGDDRRERIRVVAIPRSRPASEMVRFFNEAFVEKTRQLTAQFPRRLEASLLNRKLELDGRQKALQFSLLRDVRSRLDRTLSQWERLHRRIQAVLREINQSKADIDKIEGLLRALPPAWEAFFANVLAVHLDLSRGKRAAFVRLKKADDDFEEKQAQALNASRTADVSIQQCRQHVQKGLENVSAQDKRIRSGFQQLNKERGAYLSAERKLTETADAASKELQEKLRQAGRQGQAAAEKLRALDADLVRTEAKRAEVRQRLKRIEVRRRRLDEVEKEIDSGTRTIETETARQESREKFLTDRRDQLRKAREALRAKGHARELQLRKQLQAERTALHADRKTLKAGLGKLAGACRRTAALAGASGQLLSVFQRRPGRLGRWRAQRLFGRLLRLAPPGFWQDAQGGGPASAPASGPRSRTP